MRDAGVRLLADSSSWGSIGFLEGVVKFPRVYPVLRKIGRLFEQEKPDVFVPVDYRVFNMRASRAARARGLKVVYFFAPVNWFGSGGKRFKVLAETVDLSLVALPLSLDGYRAAGANFEFIGHPLADVVKPSMSREDALRRFGLEEGRRVIGLMPGSRTQEVNRLLPVFVRAAPLIRAALPDAQFILLQAAEPLKPLILKYLEGSDIKVASESAYDFMNVSDLLVLCSGTAAHEATLMKKPMIITYKLSAITAWIARRTVAPPMVGLPNILAGEFVVPELIQEDCTPEKVSEEAINILLSDERRVRMSERLGEIKEKLGGGGVLERAARRVVDAANGNIPMLSG